MDNHNKLVSIKENLKIVSDFVMSHDYTYMCNDGYNEPEIKEWVDDFDLRRMSFNFFFDNDPTSDRAHQEASLLAEKICKFLNYE